MNRLSGNAQANGDLLPGPVLVAGVADLQRFQALDDYPQRSHCSQSDGGVLAARLGGQLRRFTHNCHLRLTEPVCQPRLTAGFGDRSPIPVWDTRAPSRAIVVVVYDLSNGAWLGDPRGLPDDSGWSVQGEAAGTATVDGAEAEVTLGDSLATVLWERPDGRWVWILGEGAYDETAAVIAVPRRLSTAPSRSACSSVWPGRLVGGRLRGAGAWTSSVTPTPSSSRCG